MYAHDPCACPRSGRPTSISRLRRGGCIGDSFARPAKLNETLQEDGDEEDGNGGDGAPKRCVLTSISTQGQPVISSPAPMPRSKKGAEKAGRCQVEEFVFSENERRRLVGQPQKELVARAAGEIPNGSDELTGMGALDFSDENSLPVRRRNSLTVPLVPHDSVSFLSGPAHLA